MELYICINTVEYTITDIIQLDTFHALKESLDFSMANVNNIKNSTLGNCHQQF